MADNHETDNTDDRRMSFGDHLEELRRCLILALVGMGVALVLMLVFGRTIIGWLYLPLAQAQRSAGLPTQSINLSPTGGFTIYLKVSIVAAIIVSAPWLLYQFWRFVAVGLYINERRIVRALVPFSASMTAVGVLFMYYIMLPVCLWFFISFSASFPEVSGEPRGLLRLIFPLSQQQIAAPFTIKDGPSELDTVLVDQRQAPNDLAVDDANWQILGTFTITGTMLIVEVSDNANGAVVADAIRIAPAEEPPPTVQIIDNDDDDDPAFNLTGPDWSYNSDPLFPGYETDITTRKGAGTGENVARWNFTVEPGVYQVSATWSAPDRLIVPTLDVDPDALEPGQIWMTPQGDLRVSTGYNEKGVRSLPLMIRSLLSPMIDIHYYFNFVAALTLGIVIAFQLPVIMLILGWTGIVDPSFLAQYRRYCVFVCFALGMLLTPSDVLSMILLALPLWGLFELGLIIMRRAYRRSPAAESNPPG